MDVFSRRVSFPFKCRKAIFRQSRKLKGQNFPLGVSHIHDNDFSKLVNLCPVKKSSFISTYVFTGLLLTTEDMKKGNIQVPQQNEMLITAYLYTVLHLVLLVKMKNIIPNKITNGRYLKKLVLQKIVWQ